MGVLVKVYTPIKRVPTMIGKAHNGQKLPFGPYTLPQAATAAVLLLLTAAGAMVLPANPAVSFGFGLGLTVLVVFAVGLVPYTGVRVLSRAVWLTRLVVLRKPVSASGMPVTSDSARATLWIEATEVLILPREGVGAVAEPVSVPLVPLAGGD
ncbi:hypothetical protein [Nocardia sp. NPDC051832]|uniref:hypothetical protein n=1 Tax=Nocardia sp. NPDC051832 TaxID=3155673 RepID=UPI003441A3EF